MARKPNAAPPPVNGADTEHKEDDLDSTIVEVVDGETQTPSSAAPAGDKDPGVASLEEQLAEANRRREAAEREAEVLRNERGKDAQVIADSRLLVIDSTIQTNETKLNAAKSKYKEALESGDYDAQVEAQAEIADVTVALRSAKLGKDRLEQEIEQAKEAPQTETDKFEKWADDNRIHPRSRAWLREHMDYVTDSLKNAELMVAHQKAVRAGVQLNTDAYFEALETNLGLRSNDGGVDGGQETETETSAPAAPVSRSVQPSGSRSASPVPGITVLGPGRYRVTKEIAEAAQISGLTTKEYVEQALKLQRGADGQLH